MARRIDLFYDVVSPYSWIGFEVLCRYRSLWNIQLNLRPVYLGAIMGITNNTPPALVPARGRYLHKDLLRQSKYHDVPLRPLKNFVETMIEKGSLPAMRFITAVGMQGIDMEKVSRSMWMRIWSNDIDITEPDSLRAAGRAAGLTEEQIDRALEMIGTPEVKNRLKQVTEEALRLGAFGAPTIIAYLDSGPEMVFGSDRFHLLADMLGEKFHGPANHLAAKL